tara:strand:- start:343 stop:540 length:198 start_codon:yes stop_codon:yes gene_type:complete
MQYGLIAIKMNYAHLVIPKDYEKNKRGKIMLLCRWCKRKIADAGNPNVIYSNCNDCKKDQEDRRK